MIDDPQIRPGFVAEGPPMPRVVAFFRNSAMGNLAIQVVIGLGAPADRLGVTPPEGIAGGQGMVLSIACPESLRVEVEAACRKLGAEIHRQSD